MRSLFYYKTIINNKERGTVRSCRSIDHESLILYRAYRYLLPYLPSSATISIFWPLSLKNGLAQIPTIQSHLATSGFWGQYPSSHMSDSLLDVDS